MITTEPDTEIINIDAPNTEAVNNSGSLVNELAATSLAILDKREERRSFTKKINEEIKKLESRQCDIATTIRAGGIQLAMNFGTIPSDNPVPVSVEGPKKRGRRSSTTTEEEQTAH